MSVVYFCRPQLLRNVQLFNLCSFLRIIQVLQLVAAVIIIYKILHFVLLETLSSKLLEIQGMDKIKGTLDNMGIKLCWLH